MNSDYDVSAAKSPYWVAFDSRRSVDDHVGRRQDYTS